MGIVRWEFSVDIARSAVNNAKHIIASINPNVPRTHGDGLIHSSRFDSMVYCEEPLYEMDFSTKATAADAKIGQYVAELIEDRKHYTNGDWFNT
jgi:hypothetical protein